MVKKVAKIYSRELSQEVENIFKYLIFMLFSSEWNQLDLNVKKNEEKEHL